MLTFTCAIHSARCALLLQAALSVGQVFGDREVMTHDDDDPAPPSWPLTLNFSISFSLFRDNAPSTGSGRRRPYHRGYHPRWRTKIHRGPRMLLQNHLRTSARLPVGKTDRPRHTARLRLPSSYLENSQPCLRRFPFPSYPVCGLNCFMAI